MSTNHLEQHQMKNHAGLVSMDGCARETLVRGQHLATAEGHIRNGEGSSYEYLAPTTTIFDSRDF